MGIPIIQSSTWAMWFCDVVNTPLAAPVPGRLALRPRSGVYFGVSAIASEIDIASVLKGARWPSYLSLRVSNRKGRSMNLSR